MKRLITTLITFFILTNAVYARDYVTKLPIRDLAQYEGLDYNWNPEEKTVIVEDNSGDYLIFEERSNIVEANNFKLELPYPCVIEDDIFKLVYDGDKLPLYLLKVISDEGSVISLRIDDTNIVKLGRNYISSENGRKVNYLMFTAQGVGQTKVRVMLNGEDKKEVTYNFTVAKDGAINYIKQASKVQ